ncbi:MAG: FHA domain-containing protein [Planctomycetota bacterium]
MSQSAQSVDVRLVVFKPGGDRKIIQLKPGKYLIGRDAAAALRIPLGSVSRRHCELDFDGDRVLVRDLGSSNGTFCNNARITESPLGAGDVVGVGPCLMTVQVNGEPADVTPPQFQEPAEDAMASTPPSGTEAPPTPAAAVEEEEEVSDLDETVAKGPGLGSLLGNTEDSSIFDFDFDFEDDENPKL